MNTVTKVFIVLNMIAAIAVGVVVAQMYAYQENYKRRWDEDTYKLTRDLDRISKKVADLSFKRQVAEDTLSVLLAKHEALQSRKTELEEQIKERESKISNLETTISELTATSVQQREQIASLQKTLELARRRRDELNSIAQVARAVAFQLNVKLAEVEDDLANVEAELARRERTVFELEQDNKSKDALIALVRTNHPDVYKHIMGQKIGVAQVLDAVVAAVKRNPQGQQDLVMLTIGRDEEVRVGLEFTIYRGNQYICKVRAERVLNDMVACRVLPDTWNGKGLKVAPGDLASNRLF